MIHDEIQSYIRTYAAYYEIDPHLLEAFIRQESDYNTWAIRYEITYAYLLDPDEFAKKNRITRATESTLQKMSWGLGQIMGALARELGFEGLLTQLVDPKINIEFMCKRIQQLYKISSSIEDVIAMYNGGKGALHRQEGVYKNQGYVDSVKNHLQNLNH